MTEGDARSRAVVFIGDSFVDVQTSQIASLPAWDEDRTAEISIFPGGSCANTARHFGSLAPEAGACLVSAIGTDVLGTMFRNALASEGHIDLGHLKTVDTPTSTCVVLVGPGGKRAFVSTKTGTSNGRIDAELVAGTLGTAEHVHISGLFSCPGLQTDDFYGLLAEAKDRAGFTLSLDTQYDSSESWTGDGGGAGVAKLIRLSDVFIPNHLEAVGIASTAAGLTFGADDPEEALRHLTDTFPDTLIVVKCGEQGAIFGRGDAPLRRAACPALAAGECVDSCGAGDCFGAALLSRIVPGLRSGGSERRRRLDSTSQEVKEAVEFACRAGTWCCKNSGACVVTVTMTDLEGEL
mmetsp:Transcript_19975/g.39855  ORF Transcript_19975/g.39855 Transcript_19975/m.39855 type:complete len:351 (-) Transcript_19975:83-1135(-)|eukprot:CAMPEP_0194306512 /NCGR_PEP_ID=MMETSP0171-20130528/3634_1 /TAXON_ID=218684 /ORGANISM="Corethron pennatum, Strain L29A3" /LENGTH=350 /DNA_ID=CAMNT_0039058301 /DNA_START=15 /DNA_END=1067 /DNA_ORIENTATION=+